jgi:hypothetical protein
MDDPPDPADTTFQRLLSREILVSERRRMLILAALQGLAPATLAKMRCVGGSPAFLRLGRKIAYVRADLDAWLAMRRVRHTSEGDKLPRRLRDDLGARRLVPIASIDSLASQDLPTTNEGGVRVERPSIASCGRMAART